MLIRNRLWNFALPAALLALCLSVCQPASGAGADSSASPPAAGADTGAADAATLAKNKQLVRITWDELLHDNLDAAMANMTDDVVWQPPPGLPPKVGKAAVRKYRASVPGMFKGKRSSKINHLYADGDTVIAEVTNEGVARKTGLLYHNDYAFFFRIRDGKISRIWEYTDTQKGRVAFGT
jgi:ketosteroid isomerase-like protein